MKKIEVGVVANDGKGIDARNMCIIVNENFAELMEYLTGGGQETGTLKGGIPILRGGTGGTTVLEAFANLGMTFDSNGSMVYSAGSLELYDSKFTIRSRTSNKMAFAKVGTGHYTLKGTIKWGKGFKTYYPKDELGNVLCCCVITDIEGGIDIKAYQVMLTQLEGTPATGATVGYFPNINKPIDIPANRFILFNLIVE